jgi:uncharacterized protein (DUF2235 family)
LSKNIVVFSDGTRQEGGIGNNSNVYKLFNMIEDRTDRQVAYYDRGLGMGWRKATGSAFGAGISRNIRDCYEFIFNEYNAGDQIYLFGFSRGATTMRSLSNFIDLFGILPRSRPELIGRAYKIYRRRRKRKERADAFVNRHHTMWAKVKFLGVWDTVAALGIPIKSVDLLVNAVPFWRHKFQDLTLSESVEHARHALSIDDERLTFHPTLWKKELKSYQTMKQVWFRGVHTDVGGGYKDQKLSDIALTWMVSEALDHDLLLYPHNTVDVKPDHNGKIHDSRSGVPGMFFRRKVRGWDSASLGKPIVHQSVLLRDADEKENGNSSDRPWVLGHKYEEEPWPVAMRNPGRISGKTTEL